ncbi:EamA family transporter [Bacillus sp. V59.32b]|uniref:EamA family transporter n=1 Tax=Bacillus sp. V59.32b TaxID=1758642 RepID=UPI0020B14266|nr:EamA family transporter [Bacillus sp. V59.32b]
MNRLSYGILFMVFSALFTATGQALWKLATKGLFSWELYMGFFCYAVGAILMIIAFRYGSLSVLHPLLSLGYVFAIIIGIQFLNEDITRNKLMGNVCIVLGAILLGISGSQERVKK